MTQAMFSAESIQKLVEEAFPGSRAQVRDTTGTNDHFELLVVAPAFEGKGLVERHRMVYAAVGPAVGGEIHALSIRALTPTEASRR